MPLTASGQPNACAPANFGPGPGAGRAAGPPNLPPPLNFKNQTLRQIVHCLARRRPRARRPEQRVRHGAARPSARRTSRCARRTPRSRPVRSRADASAAARRRRSPPARSCSAIRSSLTVPAFADLAIDIYLPGDTAASPSPLTTHPGALQTNYVSATGNHAGEADLPGATTTSQRGSSCRASRWPRPSRRARSSRSAIRLPTARARRPTRTAAGRITWRGGSRRAKHQDGRAQRGHRRQPRPRATAPASSALARFDRDVLVQPGVDARRRAREHQRHRHRPRATPCRAAADLIAAHRQLIERAHARGSEDLRRDADAVRGRGLLHAGRRSQAAGGQRRGSGPARRTTAWSTSTRRARSRRRRRRFSRNTTPATTCT